jgi:2-polyprenyl-6-methoxyphenol hydroxylase-like FAD-dependent oxidoreductase
MLARRGLSVCLVDRSEFPSDTPSTHGIQPTGVKVLERLGALDRLREVSEPIDAAILAFDDHRVSVGSDIFELLGAPMFNVRRVTLDAILLDVAREAGAEARTRTTVTGVLSSAGRVVGIDTTTGPLHASLVVGADGARSSIAGLVGAPEYHSTAARRAFLWSYFEGVDEAERRVWLGSILPSSRRWGAARSCEPIARAPSRTGWPAGPSSARRSAPPVAPRRCR